MSYTIIDADTHVTETADLWTSRAPARMRDRVPHMMTDTDGSQKWLGEEAAAGECRDDRNRWPRQF